MSKNPYEISTGPPKMLPSILCYADILGYKKLSEESLHSEKGDQFLNKLHGALSQAYERIREHAKGFGDEEFSCIKVFSDNIVIGYLY